METANRSLKECQANSNGKANSDGILLSYYRLTQKSIADNLDLPANLITMSEYTPDLTSYDLLFKEMI